VVRQNNLNKIVKTKMLLVVALAGLTALSANAGFRFGLSIGLPLPVVVAPPVVVATPVAPAPVTVVGTIPPCLGVDYFWVPGYWSFRTTGYVWVPGSWCYRPVHVVRGHFYAGHRW
jgi:hypothetical protein